MKHCPWCYEPAVAATWTPRHGWIDLCQRHYIEVRTINCVECNTQARIKDNLCDGCRTSMGYENEEEGVMSVIIGGVRMRELEES